VTTDWHDAEGVMDDYAVVAEAALDRGITKPNNEVEVVPQLLIAYYLREIIVRAADETRIW
jgi:hypothetical protein